MAHSTDLGFVEYAIKTKDDTLNFYTYTKTQYAAYFAVSILARHQSESHLFLPQGDRFNLLVVIANRLRFFLHAR